MQDNNGADGNMFEVEAKNQLQITSFDVHFQIGGSYEVRVYTKAGKYAGSETNQNDWTLLQTTTVQANSAGTLTPLPALGTPVSLSTGETRSFYITTMNGGTIRYTSGTSEGNVFKQDLILYSLKVSARGVFLGLLLLRVCGTAEYNMYCLEADHLLLYPRRNLLLDRLQFPRRW
jgi:hypothetical protein